VSRAFRLTPPLPRADAQHEFTELVYDLARHRDAALHPGVPADVQEAFLYHDADRTSSLDSIQLREALRSFGFDPSITSQSAELLRQYDSTLTDSLRLADFNLLLHDLWNDDAAAHEVVEREAAVREGRVPPTPRSGRGGVSVGPAVDDSSWMGQQMERLRHTWPPPPPPYAHHPAYHARHRLAHPYPAATNYPPPRYSGPPDPLEALHVRPVYSPAVQRVFERYDDERLGLLDAARTRVALLHLGVHASHGEVASLVRRYGGYLPGFPDATVSLPQFGSILNHIARRDEAVRRPWSAISRGHTDILPTAE
jgi:hypothetical protein